jgi:pristinamycin I synthase-3/4
VSGASTQLSALSREEKLVLLARLAQEKKAAAEAVPAFYPLSFAQQRFWFLDQLQPGSPVYNMPVALRLLGKLSIPALRSSLREVVRRHGALRTTFVLVGGQPFQKVAARAAVPLGMIDLGGLGPREREGELARLVREHARQPFDLARGPLLRASLVRLGEAEHAVLLNQHHIVSDGWSTAVLEREVVTLYGAFAAGRPSPLPELSFQYADFAVWQRGWLAGEVLESQVGYWRERLAGLPALLELPADRPRPAFRTHRGARCGFRLPLAKLQALKDLGRREGVTDFMILLALFQAFLSRVSGQEELAVGTVVANRGRPELEPLIGCFANTLVMRGDLSGRPSLRDLLLRTRESALGAYAHQDLPFEQLVETLQPVRTTSYTPVFQVMLALQNAPQKPFSRPGLEVARIEEGNQTGGARFDLTFDLVETPLGLAGKVEYATDLFDATTVRRLAEHFANLLSEAAAAPSRLVSELPLVSPGEQHQLLCEWNDTRAPFPEGTLLHQFFEVSVERSPEKVAAVCSGRELTYADLEARSNRVAHLLQRVGVGRGTPVGIWVERSLDMLSAVLGVLKAGGHYVALDDTWPADRVESILASTGAPAILAGPGRLAAAEEMRWRLPALSDVVCLGLAGPEPSAEAIDPESVRELWDYVAERAVDRATAGGFVSVLTGEPMSEAEVDEYRDRVLSLAAPWLHRGARVLEIGSGSGLLLWEMAARGAHLTGIDPSPVTQERNREHAAREGIENVELRTGFAHELDALLSPGERFDLVLLASTVQFFPGPFYLERVVRQALGRLAPGGAVLVADVLDARRREELRRAIEEHRGDEGAAHAARRPELYLDEDFFRDLGGSVHHRTQGFPNELRFRYDVLLTGVQERRKRLWTGWHADRCPAGRLPRVCEPEDVAYVIHTSGSTGEPKGIVVQHRPAANLVDWINRTFEVGPEDRGLFITSLCFDLSVYDIFGMLAAGGTVHVATEEELADPDRLVSLLRNGGITLWDSAPAALVQLAPLFPREPDASSRLRRVLLSGDWIPVTLPDRVRQSFPGARVLALGGATEATVWSNWFPVGEVDPRWSSIPYGRPIANARYHVLDVAFAPCPVGVPGDLYIGGDCLCAGYRRPELTAEAFLPDPVSGAPGARLYRTGDRARYGADGNLEFLGRLDQQVKVRGYRIELGEIEVALARHPGVREAVVLAREDEPGDRRLVAYVVPAAEPAPSPAELRGALQRSLPEYMVPAAFVALKELPVTPNGKLDRRALPAPERVHTEAGSYAAPANPVEELLAGLFAEVLGLDRVGVRDSFFELGGHSLLATQVTSRVKDVFGVQLPLRQLFEAPTVAGLAAAVAEHETRSGQSERIARALAGASGLFLDEPDLLARVLEREGVAPERETIGRSPRGDDPPLSFAQERLWFIDQLLAGSSAYNMPSAVRLSGRLDSGAFERALGELVRRHESLRTTFTARGGRPVQVIHPERRPPLPRVDLCALGGAGREVEALRLAREEAARAFDLAREIPLRITLLRLAPDEHLVLLTLHHIASDGWSTAVFLRELTALYGAFIHGMPSPLPELPIQYADFAVWQREWLAAGPMAAQLDYWKRQLDGLEEELELPADHPRPKVESFRGGREPLVLPASLTRDLAALTRRHGLTLAMTLLAGFKLLLARASGRSDIALGVAIANRNRREVEGLIGFFVNTLVLRTGLSGGPGFRELLARVREVALGAYAHQDLPFEKLVEELKPGRDLSRNPLIQVMFGFQNFPRQTVEVEGLTFSPLERGGAETGTSKFDLTLFLYQNDDVVFGALEHSRDLFEAATVRRMLAHFENLLRAAVADPEAPVAELSLLSEGERHQLLREWNATSSDYPAAQSLQSLFEAQAARTPDAPAVLCGAAVLSYAELNRRANQLAHRLRALGVGPESRVGLSLERSAELVEGMLGILKAGGAYVPLDPGYPRERLAYMIRDSGLRVLVAMEPVLQGLPESSAAVVLLDAERELLAGYPGENPLVTTDGGNLAYVIYTSGSTGEPKGVEIPHRAISRLVLGSDYVRLGPADRVAQVANASFDAITFEVWGPLLTGGSTVVIPKEIVLSPFELGETLRASGVSAIFLTTALFNQIARDNPSAFAPLRHLLVGGDAVDPLWARKVLETAPPERLLNAYGPTETTTFASWFRIEEVPPGATTVPIGRPLANTRNYVLDPLHQPVPVGVVGELAIAGDGLARAYSGRPELTAAKLIPDPFAGGPPGGRLYRTGDRVRLRRDGAVEFIGRIDHQVKVRGFRIEPGEIEARLAEHPAVAESVVMVREDVPGDRRLVAYVVQDPGYCGPEESAAEWQGEQVSQWGMIFDDIYDKEAPEPDRTFNIIGWNSTYTGLPLPADEMREWLDDTIDRILSLEPRRVLEIGCGTGLLLFRIAPLCELYWGTDVSERALGYVEGELSRLEGSPEVRLFHRSAERFEGVEPGSFDTVILNSVVQYFPSAEYLAEVLERAVEAVRPGGAIFLGDLRSLPLLPAFHTSIELHRAEPDLPLEALRERVLARSLAENELVLDPAFFSALRERVPRIGRVEVYPKRGRAHNELTAFRYQVVLRVGDGPGPDGLSWLDWRRDRLTLDALSCLLERESPDVLALCNIPNARLAAAIAAARLLDEADGAGTAGDLQERAAAAAAGAVDPEEVWSLGRDLPYEVEIGWSSPVDGSYEVVLARRGGDRSVALASLLPEPQAGSVRSLSRYANDPLEERFARQVAPELRAYLAERLPEHMVPAGFVLLDAFPLTPNGKVDRRALGRIAPKLAQTKAVVVAPRTPAEERLAEIWAQVLGLDRVGVDEVFFELGGHSLLATQVMSRVKEVFGVHVPLQKLFTNPTVAGLAAEIESRCGRDGAPERPTIASFREDRSSPPPLSFAQERFWAGRQLEAVTVAPNTVSEAVRFEGRLDLPCLRRALQEVVDRHEVLRTSFREDAEGPVQVIHPAIPIELRVVDLEALAPPERRAEIRTWSVLDELTHFDYERAPLFRLTLFRSSETEHVLLFTLHHIAFDGWSHSILMDEMAVLFKAFREGRPSPLPPLAVQYQDFARWQRQTLRGEAMAREVAFWREHLQGATSLDLRGGRPRPSQRTYKAGVEWITVPKDLAKALEAFTAEHRVTLFVTLLTAFEVLLHQETGQDDLVVICLFANRNQVEIERLIGNFYAGLPLRTRLSGARTFRELAERVQSVTLAAQEHPDILYKPVFEGMSFENKEDEGGLATFRVLFQLAQLPAAQETLSDLRITRLRYDDDTGTMRKDLSLFLAQAGPSGPIGGRFRYNLDVLDRERVVRMRDRFFAILAAVAAHPDRPLAEL